MSFLNAIFGRKPQIPGLPTLNLGTEQQAAIAANQAALPGAEALVGQANLFSRDQLNKMIPGLAQLTGGAAISDIQSMLKGEIPTDVSQAVESAANARSLGGGYGGGSGMGRNLTARDLGLTSLDLTQRGLSSAENWMRTMTSIYAPSMMNVSSMFVTPQQMYQTTNEQNVQQFQRNWMQSQISSLPDPVMRGIHDTIMSLADAYLGGQYTDAMKPGDYGRTSGGVGGGGVGTMDQYGYPSDGGTDMSSQFDGTGGGGSFGGMQGDFGAGFGGGMGGMV